MLLIKVHRNPPLKGSSGHAQILQARQQEIVHHFIFSGHRLNELGMVVNMFDQPVRIFAHLKEICLFLRRFHFPAAVRTFPVHQLRLRPERFAGRTV